METLEGNSALVFVITQCQCALVCVCTCLIFQFAYLVHYCFCAMLFSVSHLSIVIIFWCLCYMPGVYLKPPMGDFQEFGWLLFPSSSSDYWTHGNPVKVFHENFNVMAYYAEDTMVL